MVPIPSFPISNFYGERERDGQIFFCRGGWVWILFCFELERGERQEKVSSRQGGPMGC
jgi:hypothetical protein